MAKGKWEGGRWKCTGGGSDKLELGEKAVAMETERAGIPMQPIPRHSKRTRVLESVPREKARTLVG